MQRENTTNHSPTSNQPPQIRYACLHRAIERGMANDDTWAELIRVCATLKLRDEALSAYEQVTSPSLRNVMHNFLVRAGLKDADAPRDSSTEAVEYCEDRPGIRAYLSDGTMFLFQEHMPLVVIVATLTFPLVVGLGGFLTQGSSMFLLPLIALLPGLSVLAILGGMGRRIVLEAAQGLEDPPKLPAFKVLAAESARFTGDLLALTAIFLGPAVVGALLGAPTASCIAALAVGASLLPMAVLLRQTRRDWMALDPRTLCSAVRRGGATYFALTAVIVAMFLPALLAGWGSMGASLYLQVSVVGPLAVLPTFVVARMLGSFLHENQSELGELMRPAPAATQQAAASAVAPATSPQQAAPQPQLPEQVPAPAAAASPPQRRHAAGRPATSALRQRLEQQKVAANRPAPAETHPEARSRRTPTANTTSRPAPARRTAVGAAAAAPHRASPTRQSAPRPQAQQAAPANPPAPLQAKVEVHVQPPLGAADPRRRLGGAQDLPDFTNMPGFQVLTGEARQKRAAARHNRP